MCIEILNKNYSKEGTIRKPQEKHLTNLTNKKYKLLKTIDILKC